MGGRIGGGKERQVEGEEKSVGGGGVGGGGLGRGGISRSKSESGVKSADKIIKMIATSLLLSAPSCNKSCP